MEHIRIPNFYRYQPEDVHSTDQVVIKKKILGDDDVCSLRDRDRWHFVGLLLLAHKYRNKIPYDVERIEEEISATDPINFDSLISSGLVEIWSAEAIKKESDRLRAKALESTNKAKFAQRCRTFWIKAKLSPVPREKMSPRLVNMIWSRRTEFGEEAVETVLRNRMRSKFLSGGMHGGHADMQWCFGPQNFEKILAGNYLHEKVSRRDDGYALDGAANARGFDNCPERDKERFLKEDLLVVETAAKDRGVDLDGLASWDRIKWYQDKFGRYPFGEKETE
jgi:hypothetical protein